ncbi:unnamed protein product [Zymoseptoria tritici ST99CH_3D1]|nr:unnamed protein product [Zymoseptoria tritici ST99CH_3D1]
MTRAHFEQLLDTKTPNLKARVKKMRAALNTLRIRAPADDPTELAEDELLEEDLDKLDKILNSHDRRDETPTPAPPSQPDTPLRPLRASSNIANPVFRSRTPHRASAAPASAPLQAAHLHRAVSPAILTMSASGRSKKVMFEKPDKWFGDKTKDTMLFSEWKQKISKHFQYESRHYTTVAHCVDAYVAQTSGAAWKKLQPRINTTGFELVAAVVKLLSTFYGTHYKTA